MARRLSWSDVRGGLLAIVAIGAVAAAILTFSRVGALHGDTFKLYALVGEARGIAPGSEVWLSGQRIGKITRVEFRVPASVADTGHRLLIEMDVLEHDRAMIHRDAVAQIRAGGSVIGSPVVYLSPGTARAPVLRPGDTLVARTQADFEGAASEFGYASREFPEIIANVKTLAATVPSTKGTVGAMLNSPGGGELSRLGTNMGRLNARLHGRGTVGLVMRGGLMTRAGQVMARADSVRTLLASPNTSLGRFRRDSTLLAQVADIRNELSVVQALVAEPRGTAGRVVQDSALTSALGDTMREMSLLFADIKKHPLKYLSLP